MKWFKKSKKQHDSSTSQGDKAQINQGIGYMYAIMGVQVLFALGMVVLMLFIGKVISTPWWIFAAMFLATVCVCIYFYRKVKRNIMAIKTAFQRLDLSDKNYEISIMGGMLTMRVEQNPQKMLDSSKEIPRALPAPKDHDDSVKHGVLNS